MQLTKILKNDNHISDIVGIWKKMSFELIVFYFSASDVYFSRLFQTLGFHI